MKLDFKQQSFIIYDTTTAILYFILSIMYCICNNEVEINTNGIKYVPLHIHKSHIFI